MKKIIILAAAVSLMAACNKDETPSYGPEAVVSTPAEAQDAINQGSSEIVIMEPLTADASFTIPKAYAANDAISIAADAAGKSITIAEGSGSSGLPVLTLEVENVKDLMINTPDMSVVVYGDVGGTLTSSTAANTLTITQGTTVTKLVVNKGNVRLLGTVAGFGTVASTSSILYPVSTADELRTRMTVTPYDHITNGGVVLTADISAVIAADTSVDGTPAISGAQANQDVFRLGAAPTEPQPTPAYDGYIIDGNGHKLSGAGYNNVLAIYAKNVTIKNLTVLQTADQKANNLIVKGTGTAPANNAGISLYRVSGIAVTGVTTRDLGKYGLIVNGSTATVTGFTSSGNLWGGINVAKGGGVTETPSLDLVSANITDTAAVVVDASASDATVTVPTGWTSTTTEGVTVYSPPATK